MKQISVEEAQAGMVLAHDLTDMMDRVIMKEGAVLTEPYLKKLSRWGVETLVIESDDDDSADGGGGISDERLAAVEKMFARHAENPQMIPLKSIALGYEFKG